MTADHSEVKQRVSQLVGQFPIPQLISSLVYIRDRHEIVHHNLPLYDHN